VANFIGGAADVNQFAGVRRRHSRCARRRRWWRSRSVDWTPTEELRRSACMLWLAPRDLAVFLADLHEETSLTRRLSSN